MTVKIDQARCHQLARGIDGLERARRRDFRLDRFHYTPANADVAFPPQRLTGIEHIAALDYEVEFVGRAHGCVDPPRHRSGGGRSREREQMTA